MKVWYHWKLALTHVPDPYRPTKGFWIVAVGVGMITLFAYSPCAHRPTSPFWGCAFNEGISIVTLGCRMMVKHGRRLTIFWPMTVHYSSPVVCSEVQKHPLIATIVSSLQWCINCILCIPLQYCSQSVWMWRHSLRVTSWLTSTILQYKLLSGPPVITWRCRKLMASHLQRHTLIGAKYSSSRPEGQTTMAHSDTISVLDNKCEARLRRSTEDWRKYKGIFKARVSKTWKITTAT